MMLRINITNEVPQNVCIPNESLKGKMGKKFNYHVPTMNVYRKRSYLKDIENEHY